MLSECEIEKLATATAIQLSKLPLPPPQRILNAEMAARYLGVSTEALKLWRRENCGPDFKRIGNRCVYTIESLNTYIDSLPGGGVQ